MQETIIPSKHSSNRFVAGQSPLPFPVMTNSRDWRQTIFNHERYAMLRKICHDRCVICGTTDWLQFERLDAVEKMLGNLDDKFSFLFSGLADKKTVCVCINCSLESRIDFWDRRLTQRMVDSPPANTVIFNSIQYYYALLISEQIVKARGSKEVKRFRHLPNLASRRFHYSQLHRLLGGKCTGCSQVAHLHLDCLKSQMVTHTATINPHVRIRFYYHQLVNKNLQLLCPVCDKNKTNLQQRAFGFFRRFIFGKHLVSWLKINTAAKAALERRMLGSRDREFNFKKKKDLEIISCSVHACGHKKAFNWLAAQTRKRQLWFICEDCWPKYKSTHLKLALLFELCTNVRTYRANEEPVELQQFDYANN